jgi:excisionase family DNA binding protein
MADTVPANLGSGHSRTDSAEVLLLDAVSVAEMLNISRTTFYALKAAGRLPKPIRLGRCVRWRIEEIKEWVNVGCPPLHRWEAMRDRR